MNQYLLKVYIKKSIMLIIVKEFIDISIIFDEIRIITKFKMI
jgi:hypothetical protein